MSELSLKLSAFVAWLLLGGVCLANLNATWGADDGVWSFWGTIVSVLGLAQAAFYRTSE